MIHRRRSLRRPGAAMLETALVYSALAMFLGGTFSLGLGVCAFQQLGGMAREGARWASVHGAQYATVTKNAMATPATVYSNAIQPMAVGVDTAQLTYSVTWSDSSEKTTYKDKSGNTKINYVTVTLTYQWYPAAYLTGPITLTSTAVMPMSF
jgi:Flp pilus assembly protein TadG